MALPLEKLGTTYEERRTVVDAERSRTYAAATNDTNPAYASGALAPPVFAVVPTWEAMGLAVGDVVPPEALMMIVHGEQDMHFLAPLAPGTELASRAEAFSWRVGSSGTRCTIRVASSDPAGQPVIEQYVTMFIRGMADGESAGPDKPDHTFPDGLRGGDPVAARTTHVDDDQTFRYREASGDNNPIHVDADFARSVGLPGIINHGLCTMAMTGQAVIEELAGGDPARLRRLAVRFAANVIPGNDVETVLYDLGPADGDRDGRRSYAFEALSGGAVVIKNGRAEIDPPAHS